MGFEIKKNSDAFKEVAQSFANLNQGPHSYIKIIGLNSSDCQVVNRRNASSFKTVTAYVIETLSSASLAIEEKKSLANSFEAILKPFVKKKKLIHWVFFFILIKKQRQVKTARRLIEEFNLYSAQPGAANFTFTLSPSKKANEGKHLQGANKKTVEDLKEKGIFKNPALLHSHLNESPLGTYVVWEDPLSKEYIFFQKTAYREFFPSDFNKAGPVGSVTIAQTQDLAKEIVRLTSPSYLLEVFNKEGRIFENYESAAARLELSTSYAFFYEMEAGIRQLYFIQKIPGVILQKAAAFPVKSTELNLLEMIKEQTSEKNQLAILKVFEKVCADGVEKSKAEAQLKNPGDFYVDPHGSRPLVYYIDLSGQKQHKSFQHPVDLFSEINKLLNVLYQNGEIYKQLSREGKIFQEMDAAMIHLEKAPAGSYACVKSSHADLIRLVLKIPNLNKLETREFTLSSDKNLSQEIDDLVSRLHMQGILKKEGMFVRNLEEAIRRLAYKNFGEYAIWQTPAKLHQMLVKQSDAPFSKAQVIDLDDSLNLFAHIEKNLPTPLKYVGYALNKDAAKKKLQENLEFGNFVFYPKKNYLGETKYKLFIRLSKNTYEKTSLTLNRLKPCIDSLNTSTGLWEYLCRLGYAYNSFQEAQHKNQQEGAKDYILWKGSTGEVNFAPCIRGIDFAKVTPLVIPADSSYESMKEKITHGIYPARKQLLSWLEESGTLVSNEAKAREKLATLPLGSYALWREGSLLNFLRKDENSSPIPSTPICILKNEDLAQKIDALVSNAVQLEWLKTHPRMDKGVYAEVPLAPGDYKFLKIENQYYFYQQPFSPDFGFLPRLTLLKQENIWGQIDRLTSPTFQWKTLEEGGVVVADETQAVKECPIGGWCCWRMATGEIQMLVRASPTSSRKNIISPGENLFKKIGEYAGFASSAKGAAKASTFYSTPTIRASVEKIKNDFLIFIKPDISPEICETMSFVQCVEVYKKAQFATHPDKVPEVGKAQAEARFKAFEEKKGNFLKELKKLLSKQINTSDLVFSKQSFAIIDALFIVNY
ncbi:MAG: hypothetical protein CK425_11650 [Parachlamydia sp.]|nr:MAG: hypothetical protein CK425_11650 [Parachlamydia sp.]